jgi:hypothetical protein
MAAKGTNDEPERDVSGSELSSKERPLKRSTKLATWFILLAAISLTLLWIGTLGTLLVYSLRAFFLR